MADNTLTMLTSQSLSSIDKAARQARADIAAANPIRILINAMASGQYNGRPLAFGEVKDIAKYLGDKLVPDLKSVDVNNRVTPADPAEWIEFLLRAAGHAVDVTPVHVGQSIEGVGGSQVVEIIEEGGGEKTTRPAPPPGGIPPLPDTEFVEGVYKKEKSDLVPCADESRKIPANPEAISSQKRPVGLMFMTEERIEP